MAAFRTILLVVALLASHVAPQPACKAQANRAVDTCKRPFTDGSQDMQKYRVGFPGFSYDASKSDNLLFYRNALASRPDGLTIEQYHATKANGGYYGDYIKLESGHSFIQWLFPLRRASSVNGLAQTLQLHEMQAVRDDVVAKQRVLKSYEMMLDFYGLQLLDSQSGSVQRNSNYMERYANLNTNSHNNLRISRILKSIGEFGLEHLKYPFLAFWANEVYVNNLVPSTRSSLREYWSESLRNVTELKMIRATIDQHESGYSSARNLNVCTELASCSSSLAPANYCAELSLTSQCKTNQATYCCPASNDVVLVDNVCQCVPSQNIITTNSNALNGGGTTSSGAAASTTANVATTTIDVPSTTTGPLSGVSNFTTEPNGTSLSTVAAGTTTAANNQTTAVAALALRLPIHVVFVVACSLALIF